MSAANTIDPDAVIAMRSCIQKVATGPEYSKDLSYDEAYNAMRLILEDKADPVQSAVFLIALRMKRETDEENKGILQAIIDVSDIKTAPVAEVLDIADPYDGYNRGLPASPFLAPVMAACGVPSVSHGVEAVGPKYGVTHRKVLRAAGVAVDLSTDEAVARLGNPDIGWAYVDQSAYSPAMHNLVDLRTRIVKRPCLTTVEVLAGPIRGQEKTHLLTGYVHKAYPPVYAMLARQAGFDSAVIVRGVEGGVVPSLQQPADVFYYHDKGEEQHYVAEPSILGIKRDTRSVPLPKNLPGAADKGDEIAVTVDTDAASKAAADEGLAALEGREGPTRDSLVYAGAIALLHLKRYDSLPAAADAVRKVLDSGEALARLKA